MVTIHQPMDALKLMNVRIQISLTIAAPTLNAPTLLDPSRAHVSQDSLNGELIGDVETSMNAATNLTRNAPIIVLEHLLLKVYATTRMVVLTVLIVLLVEQR